MLNKYEEHTIKAYGGYHKNDIEILNCSSGGVATALATQWIEEGGYVAGVRYTKDFRSAEYCIINKVEDLIQLKGSKYIDSILNSIYIDVKTLLEKGERVLFIGLPCKVAGLHFFLKKNYENLLTVELICHGPTLNQVHSEFIDWLEKTHNSKVVEFSVRRKIKSWVPFYLYAKFENGKEYVEEFYKSAYGVSFLTLAIERCYDCKFKGNNRTGDIQIGDFWGCSEEDNFYNKLGVSAILVHTNKGDACLKNNKYLVLFRTDFKKIVEGNKNVILSRVRSDNYYVYKKRFKKKGLMYAFKHQTNFFIWFKRKIKRMIPPKIKKLIKKILSK